MSGQIYCEELNKPFINGYLPYTGKGDICKVIWDSKFSDSQEDEPIYYKLEIQCGPNWDTVIVNRLLYDNSYTLSTVEFESIKDIYFDEDYNASKSNYIELKIKVSWYKSKTILYGISTKELILVKSSGLYKPFDNGNYPVRALGQINIDGKYYPIADAYYKVGNYWCKSDVNGEMLQDKNGKYIYQITYIENGETKIKLYTIDNPNSYIEGSDFVYTY